MKNPKFTSIIINTCISDPDEGAKKIRIGHIQSW